MDAGKDFIPIRNLDLIYSNDVIYYLNNDEIQFHFNQAYESLSSGGSFVFQIIESDFKIKKVNNHNLSTNFKNFLDLEPSPTFPHENPVQYLDLNLLTEVALSRGFKKIASKTVIESFDLEDSHFRLNRWLFFCK